MDFLEWASAHEEVAVFGLAAAGIVSVLVIRIVFSTVRHIWLGQQQLTLKQTMVDQGMSVEEITEVMKS